jgi:carotenoid phi-ring synthase / carotenoid chi-ring synthase
MTEQNPFAVVIIGGGLAGLVAGAHLASRGIAPLILDADQRWTGGRLAGGDDETFTYNGREWSFKTEHGVHAVWGGYENLRAILERFTDTRLNPSFGENWMNRWGKTVRHIEAGNTIRSRWIPAPFHYLQLVFNPLIWANISPWDFLSLPGVLASILLTVGVDPLREQKAWDGLMMRDFFVGWTPNLRATFTGLGVNLLASSADQISLTAFIAALRFYTVLRRDSWQMAYFPQDAGTSVITPLCDFITAHGGQVWRGATATQLAQMPDKTWRITLDDNNTQHTRSVYAQQVILATNAPSAQRLLLNSPDTAEIAQKLIFPEGLASHVVHLWFSKAPHSPIAGGMLTGDFAPDNFFWLHRLYPDYEQWHEQTGGSAIEVHFYPDKKLANTSDSHLLVLATTEIQTAFPELRGSFVYGSVRRNSKVHTRFRVPTADSLHVITPYANLYACGDWIGYEHPSLWMERATTTGIASANTILQKMNLEPYDVLHPPQPEWLVRVLYVLLRGLRRVLSPLVRLLRSVTKASK